MFLKKLLKEGLIVRFGITWGCSNFIRVIIGASYKN